MSFDAAGETATVQIALPLGEVLAGVREGIESLALDAGGREVPLERYRRFQAPDRIEEEVVRRMLCGVSTRQYDQTVDAFCEGYGIEKSSVSRHGKAARTAMLAERMERPLGDLDLAAVFIDGIRFGEHVLIAALGLDTGGHKHILGLWQGATENATVCKMLLGELVRRGLRPDRRHLWVLDGSKALRKAVEEYFGSDVVVQRCQVHKERNVLDPLPKKHPATVRMKLRAAWGMASYVEAKAALWRVVEHLRGSSEAAAKSLEEAFEETLHRLGVSEDLRKSLRTTNVIESCFSATRTQCRNVKRWRSSEMAWRRAGSMLLEAEKGFRRVKGHRGMRSLLEALGFSLDKQETVG